MGSIPIDFPALCSALERYGRQISDLIRTTPDVEARIPGGDWTVRDTAVHLVDDIGTNVAALQGESKALSVAAARAPERVAELNARAVAEDTERDPAVLGDRVAATVDALVAAARDRGPSTPVDTPWYGEGVALDVDTVAGVMLGELIVHGYDIAKATSPEWPIERTDAALVTYGVADMLTLYVDPAGGGG